MHKELIAIHKEDVPAHLARFTLPGIPACSTFTRQVAIRLGPVRITIRKGAKDGAPAYANKSFPPELRRNGTYYGGHRDVPKIGCRELGGDCDYVVEGQTTEQVKLELLAHVEHAHGDRMARMSQDERDALDVRIDSVLRRR